MAKKTKKAASKKQKTEAENPYFEGIRDGLLDVINSLEKGKPLTYRQVSLPEAPAEMKAKEIVHLRKDELKLSQQIFAVLLNVSPKTVQAWEQSINSPSGPALRLLWLVKQRPDVFRSMISGFKAG